jgi:PAS domain S-box-containing protein
VKCIFNMFRHLKIPLFIILFLLTVSTGIAKDKSSNLVDYSAGKGLSNRILLTEQEQAWLDHRHTVRVRIGNAPPYHTSNPEPQGISVDYLKLIGKRFGINFNFVPSPIGWEETIDDLTGERKWFDLLITMKRTPEREKEIAFTQEYLFSPWVIINRTGTVFVSRMDDLNGKSVAIERGYVIKDQIKDGYPQIKIVFFDKTLDALQAVATGSSDAYVGNLTIATYLIQKNGLNDLRIAAPTPFGSHDQAMGVRRDWPELASIINKALTAMSDAEKNEINNRWISVRYEYGINMKKVWSWVAGLTVAFLLIIAVAVIWNRRLKWEIDRRVMAEESLRESEANYRQLFDSSPTAIYQIDFRTGKFLKANDALCEYLGCSQDEITSLTPYDIMTKESQKLFLERLNKMALGDKVPENPEYEIIDKNGKRWWIQLNAKNIYDSEGLVGADVVAHDITERKQAEEKLQHTLDSLRRAVGTTIQVMVSAVETRDPYTAGHQIRSADLARAIAAEMGLSQEKIDGIRIAGSIHDIGKLSIPAEILSKPKKLTEIEFSLIKEHSQKGYEMLEDVESPWPLAQIVYQHHERMNGTGYPRNLKGDDILMEARILAVADVVEAMASHRPYRPARGIDPALEEIEKNRGTLYDNAAADACLRLFREKGFQLEGT